MNVVALQVVHYETPRGPWHAQMHRNPAWSDIELAIRNLDRCLHPFIFLYRHDPVDKDQLPDLQVVGGCGEYSIEASQPDHTWLSYVDMERSSREIDIWISDQGSTLPEFRLCPDLV